MKTKTVVVTMCLPLNLEQERRGSIFTKRFDIEPDSEFFDRISIGQIVSLGGRWCTIERENYGIFYAITFLNKREVEDDKIDKLVEQGWVVHTESPRQYEYTRDFSVTH